MLGIVALALIAGCGKSEPTATVVPPVDTPHPSPTTAMLPTDTPPPANLSVPVPQGNPATLDGHLSPDEWDGARVEEFSQGGELLMMHDDGYLYLGIRSRSMGYGSICIAQDSQISILHSSAALGCAVFEQDGNDWRRTQQFSWCCRSLTDDSPREAHLQREGWSASIGYLGAPEEMEYQIVMPKEALTLAVVYQEGSDVDSALWWPENLDDDCLGLTLLPGDPPERLQFSPEKWMTVTAAAATDITTSTQATASKPEPVVASSDEESDYWPTEGWRISTPEQQGMDSEMLADMLSTIQGQDYAIDGVTVVRNGYVVADATVYPFGPDSRHIIHSCTKSIVSALIGIAIERGYIEGVDQPMLNFFPERSVANLDAEKEALTLEHLLTMASGLECRDSYLYNWRGLEQMRASGDWVQFVLDLPVAEPPGSRFEYCNGASFLLSAIIQETTGKSALAFAQEHLFGPLGISDVEWPSNPQGINIGWGELHMRPHDMAKIGYLYLNKGRWDGEQIVPSDWVQTSTRKHIAATLQDGYGYQWWVTDSGVYMALGYAGQFIFVVPEQALVVVFVSDLQDSDFYVPQRLLEDYVIPAIKSFEPLPDNPAGVATLESQVQALAKP
jgi:CubicO group peptidase (beta-lactamase class C family)